MTTNRLDLSHLRPCDQLWNNMPDCGEGKRKCLKCENVLVDFRHMKDMEVNRIHAAGSGKVCGIYSRHQLTSRTKNGRKNILTDASVVLGMAGLLTTAGLHSQTTVDSIRKTQGQVEVDNGLDDAPIQTLDQQLKSDTSHVTVIGRLTDVDGEPLPYSTVHLLNSQMGANADMEGYYSLDIPVEQFTQGEVRLTYSYVGYGRLEKLLTWDDFAGKDTLQIDISMEDAELIAFYVVEDPWHIRTWRSVKNLLRRKDR